MSDRVLRSSLIRLAQEHPNLRKDLLPILDDTSIKTAMGWGGLRKTRKPIDISFHITSERVTYEFESRFEGEIFIDLEGVISLYNPTENEKIWLKPIPFRATVNNLDGGVMRFEVLQTPFDRGFELFLQFAFASTT